MPEILNSESKLVDPVPSFISAALTLTLSIFIASTCKDTAWFYNDRNDAVQFNRDVKITFFTTRNN